MSGQERRHDRLNWSLIVWLFVAAVSVPLGWWVARPMAETHGDLVWATVAVGPPWIVFRFTAGDFRWNAFFFGFLPPVLAFEAMRGLQSDPIQAVLLVATAPLLVYVIIFFTNGILYGGAAIARLARTALTTGGRELAERLWRRFGATVVSAARWYGIWLGGTASGFLLALAAQALVRAAGAPADLLPLALASRAIDGLIAGGLAWALLKV